MTDNSELEKTQKIKQLQLQVSEMETELDHCKSKLKQEQTRYQQIVQKEHSRLLRLESFHETVVKLIIAHSVARDTLSQPNSIPQDSDHQIHHIAESANEAMGTTNISIWAMTENSHYLKSLDFYDSQKKVHSPKPDIQINRCPDFLNSVNAGLTYGVNDISKDSRIADLRHTYALSDEINSLIVAPVKAAGKVTGVIIFEHSGKKRQWHMDEVFFAGEIADHLGQMFGHKKHGELIASASQMEQTIKNSENTLEVIFNSAPLAILLLDEDGKISKANEFAREVCGAEAETLEGNKCGSALCCLEAMRSPGGCGSSGACKSCTLQASIIKTLHTGKSQHGTHKSMKRKIGSAEQEIHFLVSTALIESESNRQVLLCLQDITHEKDIQIELNKARKEAEEAAKVKSEFLANMSHEIRTPLNGVIGITEQLLETKLDTEQLELAHIVQQSGNWLLTVINDILDLSKIEAGRLNLKSDQFSPKAVLLDLEKLLSTQFQTKGIELIIEIKETVPEFVSGDAQRLQQVLINLVGNALKFTSDGGSVVMMLEVKEETDSDVVFKFSVIDTGIGISSEDQQKIFEAFQQADMSHAKQVGGTGLGLSICKNLVKLMHGHLKVSSLPDKGSVFSFSARFEKTLKLTKQTEANVAVEPEFTRPLKVLVAEDNKVNQLLITRILEKAGCSVEIANNGKEAVSFFKKSSFDIILMDIQMPIMGGLEATAAIRKDEESGSKSIPVIALTAFAQDEERDLFLKSGMDAYISKPIKRQELLRKMIELTS